MLLGDEPWERNHQRVRPALIVGLTLHCPVTETMQLNQLEENMARPWQALQAELSPERLERIAELTVLLRQEHAMLEKLGLHGTLPESALDVLQPIRNTAADRADSGMGVNTLREYVEALGGRLEIKALFPDRE